jgi:hypothetical protein
MKPHHFAAVATATVFTLAACAENPVAPASSDIGQTALSPSFSRDAARAYKFTRFDVEIAETTYPTIPSGINASGVIVGWYFQGTGCPNAPTCIVRGFIFKDGAFTTVVYRDALTGIDAQYTFLRGIGPSGKMVGSYRMAGEPAVNLHGFLLTTAGEFVRVDYPGHINSVAQRILPDGTIIGCYHDTDQMMTMHGTVIDKNGPSAFAMATTMHNGATPNGHRITGFFTDAVTTRAYVLEGAVFTPFDAPGSVATQAWDMNPSGTIVGLFVDGTATNSTHGFVLDRGQFSTIDYPGSVFTDTFGINASGDIVGRFREFTGGPFHGYIATRKGGE